MLSPSAQTRVSRYARFAWHSPDCERWLWGVAFDSMPAGSGFDRELRKGGLSEHMIDVHVATIEDFAHETLLATDPPRGIFNLTDTDLLSSVEAHPGKQPLTSFKRFLRFLLNTGRIDYDLGEHLHVLLNQVRSEK